MNGSGSITSVGEERANLSAIVYLYIMWFLFGEVSSSSGCLGWATLFYCGTPWAFHIIILYFTNCVALKVSCSKLNFLSEVSSQCDYKMSLVMRKPAFCICENKEADQLRGNREADQHLCFRYTDSTIPLLPKSENSSL